MITILHMALAQISLSFATKLAQVVRTVHPLLC